MSLKRLLSVGIIAFRIGLGFTVLLNRGAETKDPSARRVFRTDVPPVSAAMKPSAAVTSTAVLALEKTGSKGKWQKANGKNEDPKNFIATRKVSLNSAPSIENPKSKIQNRVIQSYAKLPFSFESNRGQTEKQVHFLSRGRAYTLFLTSNEAVLVLQKSKSKGKNQRSKIKNERIHHSSFIVHHSEGSPAPSPQPLAPTLLRMKLVGANPAPQVSGLEELPGKSNYFIGNDPKKWRTNVPNYAKVQYKNVYPGVDLTYYGNQQQLEYDFVVSPGADPRSITLAIDGAGTAKIDAQGNLVLRVGGGQVRLHKPVVYQPVGAGFTPPIVGAASSAPTTLARHFLAGRYVLRGAASSTPTEARVLRSKIANARSKIEVGFEVMGYDPSQPLVIDPVLSYSTYFGGSGRDEGNGIAVDISGNAYVTGTTASSVNFPTKNAFQGTYGGACTSCTEAFVAKLNPAASGSASLVYSTYLGGSGPDEGNAIAVDASGNAYVTGGTLSSNFPTTPGAFQTTFGGGTCGTSSCSDAFVTKLNAAGNALLYSSYLGGGGDDVGIGIATDSSGNAYVAGRTLSLNFPTKNPFQPTFAGGSDGFLAKLNPAGSGSADLLYSTYLGSSGSDFGDGVAVDSSGNAYVTGRTNSTGFPTTPGAFQTALGGGTCGGSACSDAFLAKLNPASSGSASLLYSTYLGGSGNDAANGIAVDASGNVYVTGITSSTNFPTRNAFQAALGGGSDAFVAKLNPAGAGLADLLYSTYLGGSGFDQANGIALEKSFGNAYVTGETTSTNFPTANPIQAAFGGGSCVGAACGDAFVAKLNPAASGPASLLYSTYLGGSGDDGGNAIAVDSAGDAYVAGTTDSGRAGSTNFPTRNAFQATFAGSGTCTDFFSGQTFPCPDVFVVKILTTAGPRASLSTTSLAFVNQLVGTTSAPQPVTLTNSGSAPLTIASIATSGDFAQTNNCPTGSSLAAGANCTINVTFTPTAAGNRTGTITITDNTPDSPQTVTLAGSGIRDFSISASPTAATITAGQTATYTLTITPSASANNQTVSLTCSGAPPAATCAISPASVNLNGLTPGTPAVTVTTTARSITAPGRGPQQPFPHTGARVGLPWLLGLLALIILASLTSRYGDWRRAWLGFGATMLLVLLWTACGGRGGRGGGGNRQGTPPGSYTLTLTGASGSLTHSTTVGLTVN